MVMLVVLITASNEVQKTGLTYLIGLSCESRAMHLGRQVDEEGFEKTNHAVVCMGWGVTSKKEGAEKYWLIKNSWGRSW